MTTATAKFSTAARQNIEETGIDYTADVEALRSGETTREALLDLCLDGADDDRIEGWRDYVSEVVRLAG